MADFWVREISSHLDPVLARIVALYETAIPPSERIGSGVFMRALQETAVGRETTIGRRHLYAAMTNDAFVGFAFCQYFHSVETAGVTDLGYLPYMAVAEEFRGSGVGSHLYRCVLDGMRSDALRRRSELSGLVFEVERPDLAPNDEVRLLRKRRIAFYERLGARVLEGIDYIQPAVADDQPAVPLHLMYHPVASHPCPADICAVFYRLIFGYENGHPEVARALQRAEC